MAEGTYRNRDYHQTRATRDMAEKRSKFVKESKFSFLTAVVDQYAYLMDLKKEDFILTLQKNHTSLIRRKIILLMHLRKKKRWKNELEES